MDNWIELEFDPATLEMVVEKPQSPEIHFEILLSPYDIPEAVRAYHDEDKDSFVIEFKYIGNEVWNRIPKDSGFALRIGSNSNRLYGIEVDTSEFTHGDKVAVALIARKRVVNVLKNLASSAESGLRLENYRMASEAVAQEAARLFSSMAT